MNKKTFILIFLVAYLATFLRLFIDNILIISLIGSFIYGFIINRKISNSKKEVLLSGFCACFTSYSGFINFLYELFLEKDFIGLIFYLNFIIFLNLFVMYFGYLASRKLHQL